MLANVGLVPRVPSHPNPLPGGARGLTERVDSICRPDKAFKPHPATGTKCRMRLWFYNVTGCSFSPFLNFTSPSSIQPTGQT